MLRFNIILLLFIVCMHESISAPLHMLRIRNLLLLFVEAPNGEVVDVLYAAGSNNDVRKQELPGNYKNERDLKQRDTDVMGKMERKNNELNGESAEFDPNLDGPRAESSVIQAPRFRPPCESGHRKDKHGKCRRIW